MSLKEFVKIAVGLREHPKVLKAGDEGGWLYVCAIMWSKEHDTDGFIPEYALPRLTGIKQPGRVMRRCLDANLFEVAENGWRIHDYLEIQESSERRKAAGKKAAEARWAAEKAMRIASESHTDRNANAMRDRNAEEEEEEEREEENTSPPTPAVIDEIRPDVLALCELLASLIRGNDPKAQPNPRQKAWTQPTRLLLDKDRRDPGEVERVIRFCQADDFWRSNVLSMGTLRKQYTRLLLRMNTTAASAGPGNGRTSMDDYQALKGRI